MLAEDLPDIVYAYVICSCSLALDAPNTFNSVTQDRLYVEPGMCLGAFAKLRKATVTFLMTLCVRPFRPH